MDPVLREVLSDELNLKMIVAVCERPRSARELSQLLGIPVSRTYRRIKRLENEGILGVRSRVPSGYGKRENLYESRLQTFEITYEVGALHFRFEVTGRPPVETHEKFRDEIVSKLNSAFFEDGAPAVAAPPAPSMSGASPTL